MFQMRDSVSSISVLNSDNIKLMSTDNSIDVTLDTLNKVFDFRILNLLPTLKLGTITDNENQFGAPSNNTVQYNAQSNIKYTSSNGTIRVQATTSGIPNYTTDTLDITIDSTPATTFTPNIGSVIPVVVSAWTAFQPVAYSADVEGLSSQNAGSFTYRAPK